MKDKNYVAGKAKEHLHRIKTKCLEQIMKSTADSVMYDEQKVYLELFDKKDVLPDQKKNIIVVDKDTSSAIREYNQGKTLALNFSSYTTPGGAFLGGSSGQQEMLCHFSTLYPVLDNFNVAFFKRNEKNLNKALYTNSALYTPNILVFDREKANPIPCDILSCAAPHFNAAQTYNKVTEQENLVTLKSRIKFILDIAKLNQVETLILGAWGCGIYGQKAEQVADVFESYLITTHKCFKNVIFAIPNAQGKNYLSFKRVFENKGQTHLFIK